MSSDLPNGDTPSSWAEWGKKWKPLIMKQRGYLGHEWVFAQDIIMEVPGLKPSDVIPQYSFFGNDGVERHIDYAILVGDLKIAIEVEGWDKSNKGHGKTKAEHDEFNRRIQSLTTQGWRVLPVTNAQHHQEPAYYQHQIRLMLIEAESKRPTPTIDVERTNTNQPNKTSKKRMNIIVLVLVVVIASGGAYFLFYPGNSKNCSDWDTWEPANAWFQRYDWIYGDVAKLDGIDRDGIPCEKLLGAP